MQTPLDIWINCFILFTIWFYILYSDTPWPLHVYINIYKRTQQVMLNAQNILVNNRRGKGREVMILINSLSLFLGGRVSSDVYTRVDWPSYPRSTTWGNITECNTREKARFLSYSYMWGTCERAHTHSSTHRAAITSPGARRGRASRQSEKRENAHWGFCKRRQSCPLHIFLWKICK